MKAQCKVPLRNLNEFFSPLWKSLQTDLDLSLRHEGAVKRSLFASSNLVPDLTRTLCSFYAASPKTRECALLLRSTSTLSVVPNSTSRTVPSSVKSPSGGPGFNSEQGDEVPFDTTNSTVRGGSAAILEAPEVARRSESASTSPKSRNGPVLGKNAQSEAERAAIPNGGGLLTAAEAPSSSGHCAAEAQPLNPVHTQTASTTSLPPTRVPQGPPLQPSVHYNTSTTAEMSKRNTPPKAPATRPPPKPTADVSTSGSEPPLATFGGPPGFPGRDRTAIPAPNLPRLPSDEYGDPLPKPKLTEAQKKHRQDLIRAILTNTGDRSRLHLSSSVNELQEGGSSGADSASQGGASEGDFEEEDGDNSEGGADLLRRSNSMPQGYRDRYLVPNDEEMEYEREEAGIGKNSPRSSTGECA